MNCVIPKSRPANRTRGFTLIETALAIVIVGLAVSGMLQLLTVGSQSNLSGNEITTALNLTKNIKELSSRLAYQDPTNPSSAHTPESSLATSNDIWDLDGLNLSPPVDCTGNAISLYEGWTQQISVQTVSPRQLVASVPNDPTRPTARITVTILHKNQTICMTSWLVCAPNAVGP